MASGSSSDKESNPIEEVKVYCDEGDEEKPSSDNFTLEGIGLLKEATQNSSQELGFNAFPFLNGGIIPWNFGVLPVMLNPYMYSPQMNPQWFQQGLNFPSGFPCYPNPQILYQNDLKPPKVDNSPPDWNPNGIINRSREHNLPETPKRPYVKKPLNAFMIFMREKRNEIMVECTMKESASVNQILGKKWHELDKSEQNKYYELARTEKEKHRQMYPDWSARDNYASRVRKRRYKSPCLRSVDETDCSSSKKCRALLGFKQRDMWCKRCRDKKKCMRLSYNGEGDYSESDVKPNFNNGESCSLNGMGDQSSASTDRDMCLDSVKSDYVLSNTEFDETLTSEKQ